MQASGIRHRLVIRSTAIRGDGGDVLAKKGRAVFTIGHSTLSLEDFVKALRANDVNMVVDVRTIPRSRHNPQFNKESLPKSLRNRRIGYRHLKGLGGLRRPVKDSPNAAWRNASFRGFADYMQTDEFEKALSELIEVAGKKRVAIMCAEAVPWRCHRSLIADALLVRGYSVREISRSGKAKDRKLTPWAKVRGVRVTYPTERS